MNRIFELLVPASAGAYFPLLIEAALKGTAVLAAAALLSLIFLGTSAARRHLVWAFALGALALLPALLVAMPAWKVTSRAASWVAPLPTPGVATPAPAIAKQAKEAAAPEVAASRAAAPEVAASGALEPGSPGASPEVSRASHAVDPRLSTTPAATPRPIDWRGLAVTLWLAGALAVLATFATGHFVLRTLLRGARRIRGGEWHDLALDAADRLRLDAPFALLQGGNLPVPVAFGLLRPRVLLPREADAWPLERRRSVLLHELAHVQRHDCLVQAVAQLACALFWFHPAVWWAEARLRVERERACDDRVLAARTRASDYADHLLDVVRSLRATRLAALGAVAFAKRSSLEGRLIAVLDPRRDRRAVNARVALPAALLAALVVLPLAALEPVRARAGVHHDEGGNFRLTSSTDPEMQKPSTMLKRRASDATLENHVEWARNEARKLNAKVWWIGWKAGGETRSRGGFLTDSDGFDLDMLGHHGLMTLEDVLLDRPRGTSNELQKGPRAAAVLFRMAEGSPDRVRIQSQDMPADFAKQAFFWFEDVPAEQAFAWLTREAARAQDAGIRARLVESVGYLDRPDLTRAFLRATLDGNDASEVRRHAAKALGHDPSPESLRLLREHARSDRSTTVRRAAVEALGEHGTAESLDALFDLAGAKSDAGVRKAAFDAMGQKIQEPASEEEARAEEAARATWEEKHAAKVKAAVAEREVKEPKGMADEPSQGMDPGDFEVQRQAIESLGRYPEEKSLPMLRRIATTSPNADLRGQAVETLARLGSRAALAVVDEVIWTSRMESPRIRAVEMIPRTYPEEEALVRLERVAAEHPDPGTRRMAIEAIGRLGSAKAREFLARTIDGNGDPDSQRQAVESLARHGDEGIDRRLEEIARNHPAETVRRQAVESIGRRGGKDAADRLLALAKGDLPDDARRQAVESIGRLNDPRVKDMLLELARRSDSPEVQRQAVESLGRIQEDTMAELAELARTHPSGEVRRQAVETMSRRDPDRALPLLQEILKQPARKKTL